ncbi:MAG: MFS transporter [Chloroflexota bacterium]
MDWQKLSYNIRNNPFILPIYLPSMLFAVCQGLIVPILPLYLVEFGVSYWLVGLVIGGEGLGMLLGDVPSGMIVSRLGKKRAMWIGITCSALATAALFWTNTALLAFLCRLVSGLGVALFNISRYAYLAEGAERAKRGRAIAIFGGVARIGRFAGPAVGGFIASFYGLRSPFLLYFVLSGIAIVLILIFVKRTYSTATLNHQSHFETLLQILGQHYQILIRAGAGQMLAQTIRAGRAVIIPLYASEIIGLDVSLIGLIISIAAAVDMVLFPVAGYVMDHWGRKFSIIPCFSIQAIGMILVSVSGGFASLLFASIVIGFGNGLGSGTMMTLGADLSPEESRGEFLGVWRLIGDTGHSGAPIVVGGIANLIGLPMGAIAMAVAGFTSAAIFAFLVPETLRKNQ